MKKIFLIFVVLILCLTGNAFSYEIKPFVGLGYYTPNNFTINDYVLDGVSYGNAEYEMDSSYNLTIGLTLSEKIKATLFYAVTECPNEDPAEDWWVDYEILGLSLDYLFWSFGENEHQGMYIGVGGSYETFDTHDIIGDGSALSLMIKLGFEFKIEKLLIDFGYLGNFCNEDLSYIDSDGASNEGTFKGLGAYYFTVAFIF